MALILRYVDLRVVGFVSVYGLAASRRPATVVGDGNLGYERNKRKRRRKRKKKKKKEKKKKEGKKKEKGKRKRKENKNKI